MNYKYLHTVILYSILSVSSWSQNLDSIPSTRLLSRVQKNQILERWAVDDALTWQKTNRNGFQLELNFGYSYQDAMLLDNQKLNNPNAFSLRLGLIYQKRFFKNIFIETGLYGKFSRGKKNLEKINFISNNLKLQIPFYLGFISNEKWRFSIGVSIENNKDFDKIDFKRENNLRYDLITKIAFKYSKKIHLSFHTNWELTNSPDIYTINSPKNGLYIGVIYAFIKKNKKENI